MAGEAAEPAAAAAETERQQQQQQQQQQGETGGFRRVVPREDLRFSKVRLARRLGERRACAYARKGVEAAGDYQAAMRQRLPMCVWPLHQIRVPADADLDTLLSYCQPSGGGGEGHCALTTRLEDLIRAGVSWEMLLQMGMNSRHMHVGQGGLLDPNYLATVLGVSLARLQAELHLGRRWVFESGVMAGQLGVLASICSPEETCTHCHAGRSHPDGDPLCPEPSAAALLLSRFGLTARDVFALRFTTGEWINLLGLRAEHLGPLRLSAMQFCQLRFTASQWLQMGLTKEQCQRMGLDGPDWRRLIANGRWRLGQLVDDLDYSYAELAQMGLAFTGGAPPGAAGQVAGPMPVRAFNRQ